MWDKYKGLFLIVGVLIVLGGAGFFVYLGAQRQEQGQKQHKKTTMQSSEKSIVNTATAGKYLENVKQVATPTKEKIDSLANKTTENRIYFGSYKEDSGKININASGILGIEQWEGDKKTEDVFHVWNITLSNDNTELYMNLEINRFFIISFIPWVDYFKVNTINRLLTIDQFDPEKGILRFRFKFSEIDKDGVSVNMRLIFEDGWVYITKFKALGNMTNLSNVLKSIEFRIPEYTYIKNFPVKLYGFKSIEQKKYDELISTFSENDMAVFKKVGEYVYSESFMSELLKEMFPAIDQNKPGILKDTELAIIQGAIEEKFFLYCVKEGMSKKALTQLTTIFEQESNKDLLKQQPAE